ncbi:unnamed protein product [Amoebophrya sp. A120]|nr:unnamed protein product [Amoebophrya sp. A120]|eukprot:GSA120T00006676001.1
MGVLRHLLAAGGLLPVAILAEDASDVVQMTSSNADEVLSSEYVLVKFYAPWCGHCKSMAGDYIEAAAKLKEDGVVLAEVDATVETDLATTYKVEGYPTLYWFVKGQKKEYSGPRSADGIVEWVKGNMGPVVKTLTEAEIGEALKERKWSQGLVVAKGDKSLLESITEVATNTTMTHFVYSEAASTSVDLYRGTAESIKYSGAFETAALDAWVKSERIPLFGQINEDNFELYVERASKGLFWVCLDPVTIEQQLTSVSPALVEAYKKQAAAGKDVFPFVWLDVAEFEAHAREELGCANYPTIVLQRGDLMGESEAKVEKFVRSFSDEPAKLTAEAVETFLGDIASGKLEPMPELDELDKLDEMDPEEEDALDEDALPDSQEEL